MGAIHKKTIRFGFTPACEREMLTSMMIRPPAVRIQGSVVPTVSL